MEGYSSNEKVKPEEQRRNIMYNAFWSVCIYNIIYMCMCIELFIYILSLQFAISAVLP